MIIKRVINNNIVTSLDSSGNEIIVTGKGVAFNRKKGTEIPEELVEKIFSVSSDEKLSRFEKILQDIPIEVLDLSNDVINFARNHLSKELNDTIYLTLVDHINFSISRFLEGLTPANAMLWEIKHFYQEEFKVSLECVKIINQRLMVDLSEDEAGFIALHFVNAELDSNMEIVANMTKLIREILNIIKYKMRVQFDESSTEYFRLTTHLKFFTERLLERKSIDKPEDQVIYSVVKEQYPDAFGCVKKIGKHIKKVYDHQLSKSEELYLTMHIARLIN